MALLNADVFYCYMYKGVIYKATNIVNGKCYIGQTSRPLDRRKYEHLRSSMKENRPDYDYPLHRAIRRYGAECITWEILEEFEAETKEELKNTLDEAEVHYISKYNSNKNGYNASTGGGGNVGCIFSAESRANLSKSKMGALNPNYNKPHTLEWRENHSKMMSGSKNPRYGIKLPKYQIDILRDANMKPVDQYSMDGLFIASWDSATTAYEALGVDNGSISSCCTGRIKTAYGYIWRHRGDALNKYDYISHSIKPVAQLTPTGTLIKKWESAKSASVATGVSRSGISQCCNGILKTSGGFRWEFVDSIK